MKSCLIPLRSGICGASVGIALFCIVELFAPSQGLCDDFTLFRSFRGVDTEGIEPYRFATIRQGLVAVVVCARWLSTNRKSQSPFPQIFCQSSGFFPANHRSAANSCTRLETLSGTEPIFSPQTRCAVTKDQMCRF